MYTADLGRNQNGQQIYNGHIDCLMSSISAGVQYHSSPFGESPMLSPSPIRSSGNQIFMTSMVTNLEI